MSVFLFERAQNFITQSETFSSWIKSVNSSALLPVVSEGTGEFGSDTVTFVVSGNTANDFSLLQSGHQSLTVGDRYRTSYWVKVQSGGIVSFRGVRGAAFSVFTGDGTWKEIFSVESAATATVVTQIGIRGTSGPQTLTVQILRAMTSAGSSSAPYWPTTGTAVTSAYPFVSLDEIDWHRKDERIESTHEMRSGRQYRYRWGEKERINFRASEVSSADACQINSWWSAGTALVLQHQTRFETTSGYLVNKTQPFDGFIESDSRYFRGKIELESF